MVSRKNKNKKLILVLIFIFLFTNTGVVYSDINQNIKFNNITIEDGLSQSTVESIYQDSRGYIWLGTNDGLDRYNGYEFKHYKYDKYDNNSLVNNYIVDITEDRDGYMWISTLEGISKINPDTDEIKNYSSKEDNGNLSDNSLCEILNTNDNKIIAATSEGLNLYDKETDKFIRVLDNEEDLPSQYIYSIKQDSRNHIWIGTDAGLVETDKDLNVIKTYEDTIGEADIYSTYDDFKGNIWVCTLGDGLFRINLDDNTVVNYRKENTTNSISSNNVKDVAIDSNGKLWIATDKGINKFDYNTENFVTYNKEPHERDGLVDDNLRCLLKDSSGLIWIGAYSGISVFNPNSNFYHFKSNPFDTNSLSGSMIHGIYKDNDNMLWVGTNKNGLNLIDGDTIKHLNQENSDIISDSIHDITGFENYVFIGTNDGLSVVVKSDSENYTIKNYTEENGLPSKKIRSLFVDSKGYLWVGTNKGLAVLDIVKDEVKNITYILDEMGVSDKFIRAVYEDSKGNYYIGCFLEGGLIKINPNTKEYKVYKNDDNDNDSISNNNIRYITEDLNGNILVGTSHGINVLDLETDKFKHYTENDGLINNTVYGIIVDKNNDVWMSTNGGISKFSVEEENFKNFTVADGLQSNEFNGRSCFIDKDGYIFFGGVNGFNIIDVDDVELSGFQPKIIFDGFEVNGISRKDISDMKLRYNNNNIKVNFFTDDYRNTKSTKYFFRLKGLEDEWNVTDNNSLIFANLAPGDYTLEMMTVTQHGIESEVKTVNFIIKPPIWKSRWAIIIYCVLIVIYIYSYANKVKRLDKLVNKKTKELRDEMEKNRQLFNQILQLEQNKNNYFINLSHELRTPLNILSSISQLIKSFAKSNTVITNDKLTYYMNIVNRNCNRLLNLINNLIDHEKIQNNTYVLDKESVNIIYLVEETVLDMKDFIEEKGIELIFDTDVEEKLVECDKLDIERCVINLVSNAIKFTPEGGLIEVVVTDLDDKVQISVKDNGAGISEENQKIIFDRFNQGSDKTSEQKGGSGLGLTITKQIIKLHGGDIYVKSKVNFGSEFVIILPTK